MRSEDDAGVIDRPCPHLPLRGKLVAYAPSVHSETKLDCIYVILRIFLDPWIRIRNPDPQLEKMLDPDPH